MNNIDIDLNGPLWQGSRNDQLLTWSIDRDGAGVSNLIVFWPR